MKQQSSIKDGWFATGDIAKMLPDGFFQIVDRKKDMILVSGFNVYPNEIEDVLGHSSESAGSSGQWVFQMKSQAKWSRSSS